MYFSILTVFIIVFRATNVQYGEIKTWDLLAVKMLLATPLCGRDEGLMRLLLECCQRQLQQQQVLEYAVI